MRGFDGAFVLKNIFENVSRWKPQIMRTGTKLISITCGSSIRFIDSLNFIQLPLAQFSKAFKLPETKGYFPHFFNKRANAEYDGSIPEQHYYGCESMPSKEREEFLKWHDELAYRFKMSDEILRYCLQDVNILRTGCLKFRECFLETNNVDPSLECLTIASACYLVFQKNFLKAETIGIIPNNGY